MDILVRSKKWRIGPWAQHIGQGWLSMVFRIDWEWQFYNKSIIVNILENSCIDETYKPDSEIDSVKEQSKNGL